MEIPLGRRNAHDVRVMQKPPLAVGKRAIEEELQSLGLFEIKSPWRKGADRLHDKRLGYACFSTALSWSNSGARFEVINALTIGSH